MRLLTFPGDLSMLRRVADPLPDSAFGTEKLKTFAELMAIEMVEREGVGLASTQTDIHPAWRIIVLGLGAQKASTLCNPEIIDHSGESWATEGCLSFASVHEQLPAPASLTVRYRTVDGQSRETTCDINGARGVWHEVAHLNGELLIDRMGELQRRIFLVKVKKRRRAMSMSHGGAA
jgi:peptide deformylase